MNKSLQLGSLYLILFLSGFAGLGYEMAWARMLSVGLGHEILAVLAVIAAFFSGLALGAYSLDGVVSRSRVPGRWYAVLELVIGSWSLALIFLIPWANRLASELMGVDPSPIRHWVVAFPLPFFLLLPATAAMGATLPAMERLFSRLRQDGWSVGGLYAANTFGAVAGTLITTFVIVPELGFRAALLILAGTNYVCALWVFAGAARHEATRPPVTVPLQEVPTRGRLVSTLFLTGLLGIGYQVLVVRVISQVLENTVFTFASLLAVYLLGTAAGAALYQRYAPRQGFGQVLTHLLQALSLACLIGILLLWASEPISSSVRSQLGGDFFASVGGELALALTVFFLPTLLMGATFSHLAQAARDRYGFGRALALNTFGAALAPLLFGVVLLPLLGSATTLLVVSLAYLTLIPWHVWRRSTGWAPSLVPMIAGAGLMLFPTHLRFVTVPPGGLVAEHVEGVMATVAVVEDARGERFLKVNDRFQMGGTDSYYSDRRQAHVPLLLHPNPEDALFLGLGTGGTFAASASHPGLQATGVELIPEVLSLLQYFEKSTGAALREKHLQTTVADARRFVTATRNTYDVVVADLFHPARDGAGSLYTLEHFAAIRSRLRDGGLFCQWLPLYQLDLATLRTIIRTFVRAFPDAQAYLAHFSLKQPILGLVAPPAAVDYHPGWSAARIDDRDLARELAHLRLDSDFALFGGFLASAPTLRRFAGEGPLNTDDLPIVTFQAPEFVYSKPELAGIRLLKLVDALQAVPSDLLTEPRRSEPSEFAERLGAYWRARNAFLHAGIGVEQANDIREMLAQVREPLLSVVRLSGDFAPAYRPLLGMAQALHATDASGAWTLLTDLQEASPERGEARLLRQHLFGN